MYRFVSEQIYSVSEEEQYSLPEMPGLHTEQSGETLTIAYQSPPPTWRKIFGIFANEIVLTLLAGGAAALCLLSSEVGRGIAVGLLVGGFMYAPAVGIMFYGVLTHYDMYRSLYANWSIQIDRQRFVIHRHYRGESETVWYARRDIRRLCRNRCLDFPFPLWGRFPSSLCNVGQGGIELVLADGTVEPLPHLPRRRLQPPGVHEESDRLVNYLNRRLADRPV
jgi:hypothetical protein